VEATSQELLDRMAREGIACLAAMPAADKLYSEFDMRGPLAILVGAEQTGLSNYWIEHADHQARIPMLGKADSLNVSTSAAILLYEARRQRMG